MITLILRNAVVSVLTLVLVACAQDGDAAKTHSIEIVAQVPLGAPTVYLTGNIAALGPWEPDALAMTGDGIERRATIRVPEGFVLEYKITLGSWEREEVDRFERTRPNYTLTVAAGQSVRHEVVAFKRDPAEYMADWQSSGVLGTLIYWPDVASEFLTESRHVEVWLPPGYDDNPERRYRVIYMHDGQNLFDPRIANTGVDWGVDEAMMRGASDGLFEPAIVVGAWSSPQRGPEYSPWHDAPKYARFLIEELMPRVNAEFRTLTEAKDTFVMGSSMGGLLSFYLVKTHPDVFNIPVEEPDTTPYVVRDIAAGDSVPAGSRYFFDYGTETLDASYGPTHAAVREWLLAQGWVEGEDFRVQEYKGAAHNEAAWRARLDDQLVWLLKADPVPASP